MGTLSSNVADVFASRGHVGVMLSQASVLLNGIHVSLISPSRSAFTLSMVWSANEIINTRPTWSCNSLNTINFINITIVSPLGRSQLGASWAQPLTTISSTLQDFEPKHQKKNEECRMTSRTTNHSPDTIQHLLPLQRTIQQRNTAS